MGLRLRGFGRRPFDESDGIYWLDGTRLLLCVANQGEPVPTEFVTRQGDGCALFAFKRKK